MACINILLIRFNEKLLSLLPVVDCQKQYAFNVLKVLDVKKLMCCMWSSGMAFNQGLTDLCFYFPEPNYFINTLKYYFVTTHFVTNK